MARVTVEDCIQVVPNRFDLVVLAARRAREIASGANITVPRDNDKNPVVALREIADQTVSVEHLHEQVVRGMQRVGFIEESDSDLDENEDGDYAATSVAALEDLAIIIDEEDDLDVDEDTLDDEVIDDEADEEEVL